MFGIEKDFQQLMEQVYGPLGEKEKKESARIAKQLVDNAVEEVKMTKQEPPDTIEIGGVKYKRVETPQSFYDKLEEWIEKGNFAQSKDVLVNEILNMVKEIIPEPYDNNFMSEYLLGYNEAIRKMENNLK